jgi:GPH family glycoside/pentoside/hexuronide:cation symporter
MRTARVLAYGVLGLPLAFAALPLYVHVPRFYADKTGLSLALIGAILFGTRLLDALIDPWLGWLADRVKRPAMLAAALPCFALGFVALLHPPSSNTVAWLTATLLLTYGAYSAAMVAYQAWGADIAVDAGERTRLTAAREGFGLLGVLLAAGLPTLLAPTMSDGVVKLGWLLPLLLLVAAGITHYGVEGAGAMSISTRLLLPSLHRVFAEAAFRRLLVVFAANGIAAALPATLFLFFVADVLQRESFSSALLLLYFVAGAASLPLWVRLSQRFGRIRTWLASMLLAIVAFAGTSLLGSGDLQPFTVICVASGMALGADLALPIALAADIGHRISQAGTCMGVWNLIAKLNLAFAAGFALPLLSLLDYSPGGTSGLTALSAAYAFLPLTFKALAAALLWRWRHSLETET